MAEQTPDQRWTRRSFLGLGAAAVTAAMLPSAAQARTVVAKRGSERVLSFFNTHTGERLSTAYCCGGVYQPEALQRINFILRDFRANAVKPIDPGLLDLLHGLHRTLGTSQPFHIISGYRSPETNAMLRTRGGGDSGVASGSLHMIGKAIDIRVPGVQLGDLRAAARSLQLGGVGFYPSSNFVHVDTGRVRFW
jgi:uncharacterized protein YcbK (DUF882 family)